MYGITDINFQNFQNYIPYLAKPLWIALATITGIGLIIAEFYLIAFLHIPLWTTFVVSAPTFICFVLLIIKICTTPSYRIKKSSTIEPYTSSNCLQPAVPGNVTISKSLCLNLDERVSICYLDTISKDTAFQICSLLDWKDLLRLGQTSKKWQTYSNDEKTWQNLAIMRLLTAPQPYNNWKSTVCNINKLEKVNGIVAKIKKPSNKDNYSVDVRQVVGIANRVWDLSTLTLASVSRFADILFSSINGDRMVTANYQGYCRVYSISNSTQIKGFDLFPNKLTCFALQDNKLAAADPEYQIHVFDIEKESLVFTLQGHTADILDIKIQNDLIISKSRDQTFRFWDLNSGECKKTFKVIQYNGFPFFSWHGKFAINGDYIVNQMMQPLQENVIEVRNHKTGSKYELAKPFAFDRINKLILFGDLLFAVTDEGMVIWNIQKRKCVNHIQEKRIQNIVLLNDKVISNSYPTDPQALIWGIAKNAPKKHPFQFFANLIK